MTSLKEAWLAAVEDCINTDAWIGKYIKELEELIEKEAPEHIDCDGPTNDYLNGYIDGAVTILKHMKGESVK